MALIFTIKGELDETLLERRIGNEENENEIISWEEYWYEGEMVKRSARMYLKQGVFGTGIQTTQ